MVTVPGFDVESLNLLGKLISQLERFHLENVAPQEFDSRDLFEESEQTFFRIKGIANFWKRNVQGTDFTQYMTDLVIASHNQPLADLTLILVGKSQKVQIYVSLGSENATRTILEGIFPGIRLEQVDIIDLNDQLQPHMLTNGVITGIPSNKGLGGDKGGGGEDPTQMPHPNAPPAIPNQGTTQNQSPLERVIRGMYGAHWAFIVQAHPRPRAKVIEERMKTIDLLTQITNRSRVQWSSAKQENLQKTVIDSGGLTQTYSGDMVNYRAQYLIKLLERQLERHDQGMAAGQWLVRSYFGASTLEDAHRLSSLLIGALSGADSRPEPLRATLAKRGGASLEGFHTFLTSQEVGSLIQFPREEVPGYAVHDYVYFDSDFQPIDAPLPLGTIQHNGKNTDEYYNISLDALAKHAVVIGVTGSGKTTTVMNLLDKVVDAERPFLVIEPAKTEYRALHSAFAPRATLRVYTLGNETVSPFRLNPFEFETDDDPGNASLLTHIDFLKAVFNAAFEMYAPMPQVLEEALLEIYADKGWDLTSGINVRLADWSRRNEFPIFPTMTDLYYKVEIVTNRLGYHAEVESNVKAALKSRIGSLRIGSKGLMLDTPRGIPMEQLLAVPTILELEGIGSDDEKTFIMGLFLSRLYEYRRLQFATGNLPKGLQHLIVFEEAHRLLKNTSTETSGESANPRAQAIEVFTNMLSEVRAYGQGVLVAEQIPSKLAPDVLKNTNLKIVHRLIAQDDRQSIGQTMNLNMEQLTHLGILTPGMAAVFAEGADHAYLIRLENYKRRISPLTDKGLRKMSLEYASVEPYQTIKDINNYGVAGSPSGGPDPAIYQAAGKVIDSERSQWIWSNILLRLTTEPQTVLEALQRFTSLIEKDMPYLPPERHMTVLLMALIRGSAEIMHQRGGQFGWTYAEVEEVRILLTRGLVGYMHAHVNTHQSPSTTAETKQIQEAKTQLVQFSGRYVKLMKRQQGPFAGCDYCPRKCLYRSDVQRLLTEKNTKWINDELTDGGHESSYARYRAVVNAANNIAQSWLGEEVGGEPNIHTTAIAYCTFLHAIASSNFNEYEQIILGEASKDFFFEDFDLTLFDDPAHGISSTKSATDYNEDEVNDDEDSEADDDDDFDLDDLNLDDDDDDDDDNDADFDLDDLNLDDDDDDFDLDDDDDDDDEIIAPPRATTRTTTNSTRPTEKIVPKPGTVTRNDDDFDLDDDDDFDLDDDDDDDFDLDDDDEDIFNLNAKNQKNTTTKNAGQNTTAVKTDVFVSDNDDFDDDDDFDLDDFNFDDE